MEEEELAKSIKKGATDEEDIYINVDNNEEDIYSNMDDPNAIESEDIYSNVEDLKGQGLEYMLPKSMQNEFKRESIIKKKPAVTQKPLEAVKSVKATQVQIQKLQKSAEVSNASKVMNNQTNKLVKNEDFNTMPKFPAPNTSTLYPSVQTNVSQNSQLKSKTGSSTSIPKTSSFNAGSIQRSTSQLSGNSMERKPSTSSHSSRTPIPNQMNQQGRTVPTNRSSNPPAPVLYKKPEDLPPGLPKRNPNMGTQDQNDDGTYECLEEDIYDEVDEDNTYETV